MSNRQIQEVLAEYTPQWMQIAGVVGTAIGEHDGHPCIRVMVSSNDRVLEKIPRAVDNYRVIVEEVGTPRSL